MNKFLMLGLGLMAATIVAASAQTSTPIPPTTIQGAVDIKFNSHNNPGVKGVRDVYNMNINVNKGVLYHGTIVDTPQIIEGWMSKAVTQSRNIEYDIACDVVNPHNPGDVRNVGQLKGVVPISPDGAYQYDAGSLEMDVLNGGVNSSKFTGNIQGKPLSRPANWMDTLKASCSTVSITRNVNGKNLTVKLNKYDKMVYQNTVLCAGPGTAYSAVNVSGEMLFDYDKNCWFFNNVTMQYNVYNKVTKSYEVKIDRVTGTIRWVQDAGYASNGKSEYDFDVRLNEPPPSETGAFAAPSDDTSEFFATDSTLSTLGGAMKFTDTVRGGSTISSAGIVDLKGNNISMQQTLALTKLIVFSAAVPMFGD
jgi:hypothetical protein